MDEGVAHRGTDDLPVLFRQHDDPVTLLQCAEQIFFHLARAEHLEPRTLREARAVEGAQFDDHSLGGPEL